MAMFNFARSSKHRVIYEIGRGHRKSIHHGGLFIKPKDSDDIQVTVADVLRNYGPGYEVGPEYNPSKFDQIRKQFQMDYANDYPQDQATLPLRTMSNSFQSVVLNFGDMNAELCNDHYGQKIVNPVNNTSEEWNRKQLISFYDVFAVWLSYQHLDIPAFKGRPHPYIMISAFLDHISFTGYPIQWKKIVRTSSHVIRATESTLEVVIESGQQDGTGKWNVIAEGVFRLAARNSSLKKAIVNKLVAKNQEEDHYLQLIAKSVRQRDTFLKEAQGQHQIPLASELNLLNILKKERFNPCVVSLEDTKIEASQFCDVANRNRYYTTYGGFLITAAEEAALTAAKLFSKTKPELLHVGHGSFIKTVPIGSQLRAKAMVASTEDNLILIPVISEFTDEKTGESTVANIFHFVYEVPEGTHLPPVIPKEDQEKLTFIMGRRFLRYIHPRIDEFYATKFAKKEFVSVV